MISSQLSHVDTISEHFIFNFRLNKLKLLAICGERSDHICWRLL